MAEASPSHEFDRHVLAQLEKLFRDDDLEILVRPPEFPLDPKKMDPAVLVKHLPSGREVSCDQFNTQIRNKASCLLTLLLDTPRSS